MNEQSKRESISPVELFRTIPLFSKLSESELAALAGLATPQHVLPLRQIVRQGDLGSRFFVIARGQVNLRHTTAAGAEESFGLLSARKPGSAGEAPRNYFGEQMFSSQESYAFDADALTEVDLYAIERAKFDELVRARPDLLRALDFIRTEDRKRKRGLKWIGEGERLVLSTRKHWWALVPSFTAILGLFLIFTLVDIPLGFLIPPEWEATLIAVQLVVLFAWGIYVVYDWANDSFIVTNQRVTHIERVWLIEESRDSVPIDKVLGVTLQRSGVGGVLFGVSTVVIQTAGREEGDVVFTTVGNGLKVKQAVLEQHDAMRARHMSEERERFRSTVREELETFIMPRTVPKEEERPATTRVRKRGIWQTIRQAVQSAVGLELRFDDRVVWRKHWIVLVQQSGIWFLALVVLNVFFALVALAGVSNTGFVLLGGIVFLVILGRFLWEWEDWRNDIYSVTETQVIDSDRLPFGIRERTTTAPLDQVQNVVVDVPNFIGLLLNFGDLRIETAGKTGQMLFPSIHRPREAQEEIYRRIGAFRQKRVRTEASVRSASVVDAIVAYHRLREDSEREKGNASEGAEPSTDVPPAETTSRTRRPSMDLGPEIFE